MEEENKGSGERKEKSHGVLIGKERSAKKGKRKGERNCGRGIIHEGSKGGREK